MNNSTDTECLEVTELSCVHSVLLSLAALGNWSCSRMPVKNSLCGSQHGADLCPTTRPFGIKSQRAPLKQHRYSAVKRARRNSIYNSLYNSSLSEEMPRKHI